MPCGCYPDFERCTCTPGQIQHYCKDQSAFIDRLDCCGGSQSGVRGTFEKERRKFRGDTKTRMMPVN